MCFVFTYMVYEVLLNKYINLFQNIIINYNNFNLSFNSLRLPIIVMLLLIKFRVYYKRSNYLFPSVGSTNISI